MKQNFKISTERQVSLNGIMTFGKLETGLHSLDFMCCEDVQMKPFTGLCKVQGMRDGNVYIMEKTKRIRNNSLLICKAKHGRLSGTRDHAWQLTLKVFVAEHIDWQRAFLEETVEMMTNLMEPGRMCKILTEALNKLKTEAW